MALLWHCAHRRAAGAASGLAGKPKVGNISLKMLVEEGLVSPGENNLVSEYKGVTMLASLRADGRIACVVRPAAVLST